MTEIADRPDDATTGGREVGRAVSGALLSDDECQAMQLSADLWNQMCRVVGTGPTRSADLVEICTHIHAIQHAVLSNAAARAYPGEYRLLGETLKDP